MAAFLLIERSRLRRGKLAVVNLRLFSISSFSIGNVAALIVALGEFGILFVLPLYLQGALGLSALDTGAALIPLAAGTLVAGGATAPLAPRIGPRGVVQLGLAARGARHRLARLRARPRHLGLVDPPVPVRLRDRRRVRHRPADGRDPHRRPVEASGQGSGIQSTFRQVGSALGIAILGTILISTLGSGVSSRLRSVPGLPPAQQAEISKAVRLSGGSAIVALRERPGQRGDRPGLLRGAGVLGGDGRVHGGRLRAARPAGHPGPAEPARRRGPRRARGGAQRRVAAGGAA